MATVFFILLSIVLIMVGYQGLYYKRKGDKVDAVISNIIRYRRGGDTKHDVYVEYVYNGQFYENIRLRYYQTGFYIGKNITLYLFPDKPTEPEHAGSIIFMVIGIIMAVMCIVLTILG